MYIDETGIQGYIYREYGRALKGKKVYDKITGKKYHRINIVAGKCGDKIISPLVYEKIMDSEFFEKWFKEMFLKEVKENKVIVMDNATFHRKSKLYDLCKNANKNLRLIFLPPYSPELNPIEKYWALLKRKIKKFDKNDKFVVVPIKDNRMYNKIRPISFTNNRKIKPITFYKPREVIK